MGGRRPEADPRFTLQASRFDPSTGSRPRAESRGKLTVPSQVEGRCTVLGSKMDAAIRHPHIVGMPEQVERALVERIEKDRIDLPVLPQVAGRVMALAGDPSADAARLSALIHQDQALAAHVLRIANSPAYMPRTPIASLQHAVAMLGVNQLSEIAVTVSLKSATVKIPGHEADIRQLWRHALASGAYAKEIARMRRYNVESAYLCGLLHAVGKPVVLKTVTTIAADMHIRLEPGSVTSFLDGYHARVGSLIAAKWALPPQVAGAIAYYWIYEQAPAHKQEAMMTCLADRLATYLLVPDSFDDSTLINHTVFADLNLYPNDVDTLLSLKEKVLNLVDTMAQ
jgi:HD-like signal output (HDOD) protein